MSLLTRTLTVNASLSAITGVVLVVAAAPLPDWLGIPTWVAVLLGIGLILFAIQVLRVARGPRRTQVIQVIGADVAWVVGAATVILVFPGAMSPGGLWALGVVTAAVALFAVLQTVGLRRAEVTA